LLEAALFVFKAFHATAQRGRKGATEQKSFAPLREPLFASSREHARLTPSKKRKSFSPIRMRQRFLSDDKEDCPDE
jgi:hypothetical protein